ncbi:ribosome silencing factor [Litorivicinus lipolyticus]|nr:ribosome silencing factor [Litorivicinus lipolyticus]
MSNMNTQALTQLVVDALEDMKGNDIVTIDVTGQTSVTDMLVVASGTSNRHVRSLAENVIEKAKDADQRPLGSEGQDSGEWVLVDLGVVVVHCFLPETREFYDLESLWDRRPGDDVAAED